MWDDAISLAIGPSYPSGWGITGYASSAIFKGELIICNGQDKPVLIQFDKAPNCTYLSDLGATANVPVCKYVTSINRWVIMAGDPLNPHVYMLARLIRLVSLRSG